MQTKPAACGKRLLALVLAIVMGLLAAARQCVRSRARL